MKRLMENTLRFITPLFGDRHANMLLPFLYSIEKSNPRAFVSVYWEDIRPEFIQLLSSAFPRVEFIQTNFNFSKDITHRISSKTLVWEQAAHDKQDTSEWLVFIDTDTLIIGDIASYIQPIRADGIFTFRNGPFPINSGVVIFRSSQEMAHFFSLWQKKTSEILNTPALYKQANDRTLPYGGADQMAIHLLLNYQRETITYHVNVKNKTLTLWMAPCEDLNETYSAPITNRTRIIHFKGGWRSILFEKGYFTKNRPKEDSWDMYILYIQHFQEAVLRLNRTGNSRYTLKDFQFSVPFYINPLTYRERPFLYRLFFVQSWIRRLPQRIRTFISERLRASS